MITLFIASQLTALNKHTCTTAQLSIETANTSRALNTQSLVSYVSVITLDSELSKLTQNIRQYPFRKI